MANFCTECGKPIVDGKPSCDCMSKQKVNTETPTGKKTVKKVIKRKVVKKPMNIWEMFLAVLKAPVTSMEQVVHERYFVNGMLLCLIECALMSLSVCVLISSSIRMTYNGISSFANSFGGGYSMGNYSNYVNIPYFEIFFKLLIFYLIIKFLFVMVSMGLLNGMGKAKLTFKASFPAASGYSTGMILGMVVSIVLTFLNPIVGVLCICLSSFLALIMHTVSITGIKGIHKNICGWISFLTIMINSIITLIVFAIFAQSFTNQIQHSISNGLGGLF
jgi:hypothetical protein